MFLRAGLFLCCIIALKEGGVIGSSIDTDKCIMPVSGLQMGNSSNWADEEIGASWVMNGREEISFLDTSLFVP